MEAYGWTEHLKFVPGVHITSCSLVSVRLLLLRNLALLPAAGTCFMNVADAATSASSTYCVTAECPDPAAS